MVSWSRACLRMSRSVAAGYCLSLNSGSVENRWRGSVGLPYPTEMKFTFQFFWEKPPHGDLEPFLLPLTLKFPSIEAARAAIDEVVKHPDVPLHSMTITSDSGISGRWFQMDGVWRRKDG